MEKPVEIIETEENTNFNSRFSLKVLTSSPLIAFCLMIFLITISNELITYTVPNYLNSHLGNTALMGFLIALSGLISIGTDIFLGEAFVKRNFRFFIKVSMIISIGVPLTFLILPNSFLFYLIPMIIWGIFSEFQGFGISKFMSLNISREQRSNAWGVLSIFQSIALIFTPLIAGFLYDRGEQIPFYYAIIFILICLIAYYFLLGIKRKKNHNHFEHEFKVGIRHELKAWLILSKRIWPVLVFYLVFGIVDVMFWTTGTILTEDLKKASIYGALFLTLYSIPTLFIGSASGKFSKKLGTKEAAFLTALISYIPLILIGVLSNVSIILVLVFISSIFSSITSPLLNAIFSNYIARLDGAKNDLIGLQNAMVNLMYIVGPVIAGLISNKVGIQMTFTVVGLGAFVITLVLLVTSSKQDKMPQKALQILEDGYKSIVEK